MLTKRNTERLAGLVLLGILVSLIVSSSVGPEIDTRREEFRESLLDIANHPRLMAGVLAVGFVGDLLMVALGGLLYLVFRAHERSLALFGAFGFLAAGMTFIVADGAGYGLRSMAQDFTKVSGAEVDAIFASARGMALLADFASLAAVTFIALALLAFGALVIWSQALPRALGWLSVAGGALIPFFWLSLLIHGAWIVGFTGLVLLMLLQLLLGFWLLLRGTKEAAAA